MNRKIKFGIKMAKLGFNRSSFSKKRVGAAFIKGNRLIIGSNSKKSTPISKRLGTFWEREHAEMNVLKNASNCEGGRLFIYRNKADGNLGMARPCTACMQLIKEKGIVNITYTTEDGIASERILYA